MMAEVDMTRMLDVLCPMHVVLGPTGHVVHAGPTAQKVLGDGQLVGQRFFELVEVKRPRLEGTMQSLQQAQGKRLHFVHRKARDTEFKAVLVPVPQEAGLVPQGGAVINMSFGISVKEAVRDHALTSSDFAATDLAVEMLYLIESQSAVMEESRKLNLRLQGAKAAAEEEAFTDTLTGLSNRRALEPLLNRLIETGEDFVLANLDLDHFKAVNDTLGHAAGDHVLRRVAGILTEVTRDGDAIIRVGGDEFVLIFTPQVPHEGLRSLTRRLIETLEHPIEFNGETASISASIGTTRSADYDFPGIDQMMDDADVALYAAKEAGRGCHVSYDPALRDAAARPQGASKTGT